MGTRYGDPEFVYVCVLYGDPRPEFVYVCVWYGDLVWGPGTGRRQALDPGGEFVYVCVWYGDLEASSCTCVSGMGTGMGTLSAGPDERLTLLKPI